VSAGVESGTGSDPLAGTVAIVTGAASGMGLCTARQLIAANRTVLGLDMNGAGIRAVAAELGPDFVPCEVNVIDRDAVDRSLKDALMDGGLVTAVVNAAGIYPPTTLDDVTVPNYREIFDTNVLGTLNVTAAAMEYIRGHGEGAAIVNFASIDALTVSPGQLLYSASKAAVVALTRSLAIELAPYKVVVNAVAPGWVDTPGNRALGRMEAALPSVPLQRAAAPDEIAEWVVRLLDRKSYLTGETIPIAGGLCMH
jgi:3-oxoacyl-[acyl-carrier protein] reductase